MTGTVNPQFGPEPLALPRSISTALSRAPSPSKSSQNSTTRIGPLSPCVVLTPSDILALAPTGSGVRVSSGSSSNNPKTVHVVVPAVTTRMRPFGCTATPRPQGACAESETARPSTPNVPSIVPFALMRTAPGAPGGSITEPARTILPSVCTATPVPPPPSRNDDGHVIFPFAPNVVSYVPLAFRRATQTLGWPPLSPYRTILSSDD